MSGEALVHELFLCKAQPPLAGFSVGPKSFIDHSNASLLTQLKNVLLHEVRLIGVLGLRIDRIQREGLVAGNVKLGNRQRVHLLQGLGLT